MLLEETTILSGVGSRLRQTLLSPEPRQVDSPTAAPIGAYFPYRVISEENL